MKQNVKSKDRRKASTRKKLHGTTKKPRLCVYRSNNNIYAQLIDDTANLTIVGVSQKMVEKKGTKTEQAKAIGILIAKKAGEKKITTVVFDRGGYAYHGRVKAIAEGAREGGLVF